MPGRRSALTIVLLLAIATVGSGGGPAGGSGVADTGVALTDLVETVRNRRVPKDVVGIAGGRSTHDGFPAGGRRWTEAHAAGPNRTAVEVVTVFDGDTVAVRYPNGSVARVRLVGVDAPEVRGQPSPREFSGVPDTAAARACLDRASRLATRYARRVLAGRRVVLEAGTETARRGRYGRLLASVVIDPRGRRFGRLLLRAGYARSREPGRTQPGYRQAVRTARRAGRGVWRCGNRSTGSLQGAGQRDRGVDWLVAGVGEL